MRILRPAWLRLLLAGGLVLAAVGLLALPSRAVEFRSGDTITIGADEVVDDDLFLAGTNVVVDGTVNGDLFIACSQAQVNGTVNGSLFFAGQTVTVNGLVGGSFYAAGSSATVGPQTAIGRNLLMLGYGLRTEAGSRIGRDVAMAGYQALLGGDVARNVQFNGGALEIGGIVGGDVTAQVGDPNSATPPSFAPGMPPSVRPGLRVAKGASIGGKLTYRSPVEQGSAIQSAPAGGVSYQPVAQGGRARPGPLSVLVARLVRSLREFITLLILGALAFWLTPRLFQEAADTARARPLPAAGWGLLVWIVGWLAAIVAAIVIVVLAILLGIITLGGLAGTVLGVGLSALGLAFTIFLFLVSYASKLVVVLLVGQLLFRAVARGYTGSQFWPFLVGLVLYALLRLVPVLDWLVALAATLIGLGAIWLVFLAHRRPATAPPAP